MHLPEFHEKLKELHEYYHFPYEDWAFGEDDDLNDLLLTLPSSYPAQAVRKLFSHIGLIYSKFEAQAPKLHAQHQKPDKRAGGSLPSPPREQHPPLARSLRVTIKDGTHDEITCIFDEDRYVPAFWDTTEDTPSRDSADTARFEPFGQEEVDISVEGLYGCTTLMIVSSRGAYVAHWWENPSFRSERELKARALNGLRVGTRQHPNLVQYASQLKDAVAFLMTPQKEIGKRKKGTKLLYPNRIEAIETAVKEILENNRKQQHQLPRSWRLYVFRAPRLVDSSRCCRQCCPEIS
ncbi:hypothetical protein V8E54_003125 [Elaphomyces granulatus]